mgnify:CR=1 FL=1|jgi:uncharacterized pyridoxamine 5'-phosphate oxidase family protein
MNELVRNEIWSFFKQAQPIYLATIDKDIPRVRPVTLIYYNDKFWIATGSEDSKISQIRSNCNFEFCKTISDGEKTGYIRAAGDITIIQDIETKKMLLDNIDFISYFWKDPADAGYSLLQVNIREIEYMKIGEMIANKYENK